MTFTVAYQTLAVTMTVETNQGSNQVMSYSIICLVTDSLRYTLAFQQHRRRRKRTGMHDRHIVLAVLAIVILSTAACAPQEFTPEEIEKPRDQRPPGTR